jgi:4'-phosphopantetheinyl transferase
LNLLWPEAITLLNVAEKDRAKRYHFERHQRRFTLARAMLRLRISRYLACDPKTVIFLENQYGKPNIESAQQLQFNLSHSQELALLAIGQVHPMGIDLEYFSSRSLTGISQLMFSAAEIEGFSKVPTASRSLSFFHIWAQKEAFIKACGMGLSYPTQQFDVPHSLPTYASIYDAMHAKTWQMQSFMPEPACCAAVCFHPDITTLRFHLLRPDDHDFTQ